MHDIMLKHGSFGYCTESNTKNKAIAYFQDTDAQIYLCVTQSIIIIVLKHIQKFKVTFLNLQSDSGPDWDAVSAESSPKSECSLGLYIPSGL